MNPSPAPQPRARMISTALVTAERSTVVGSLNCSASRKISMRPPKSSPATSVGRRRPCCAHQAKSTPSAAPIKMKPTMLAASTLILASGPSASIPNVAILPGVRRISRSARLSGKNATLVNWLASATRPVRTIVASAPATAPLQSNVRFMVKLPSSTLHIRSGGALGPHRRKGGVEPSRIGRVSRPRRRDHADRQEDVGVDALLAGRDHQGYVFAACRRVEGESLQRIEAHARREQPAEFFEDRRLWAIRHHHAGCFNGYGTGQHLQHIGHTQQTRTQVEEDPPCSRVRPRRERVVAIGDQHLTTMPCP